jgi:hypothetical protein
MTTLIRTIVEINGLYDILCAISILHMINIPILNDLHLSMITVERTPLSDRYFAYWIFTYGMIRLSDDDYLVAMSYYIEALLILNELLKNSIDPIKGWFVLVSSVMLGNQILW